MITLTARNTSMFLTEGKHVVTIKSIVPATPAESPDWTNDHPQLKITFVDGTGKMFSAWYQLDAYKRFKELTAKEQQSGKYISAGEDGYAVIKKTRERVSDEDRKEKALNMLRKLAFDAGCTGDVEIEEALIGKTVGIVIGENDRQNARVKASFMPSAAQLKAVADAVDA